jgi:plastocyanin
VTQQFWRRTRWLLILIAAVAALGSQAAFADRSASMHDYPDPVEQWGFGPTVIQTGVNSWVTWSNAGDEAHTVTALDGSFDSGELGPGEGFSWFFDQPGTYVYYCALHDWMRGTVVVGDDAAIGLPAPTPEPETIPTDEPPPAE